MPVGATDNGSKSTTHRTADETTDAATNEATHLSTISTAIKSTHSPSLHTAYLQAHLSTISPHRSAITAAHESPDPPAYLNADIYGTP